MNAEGFEKKPISVGPWGGSGGDPWDDGSYTSVRKLLIAHGAGIDSIHIEYDQKGNSVWSAKHGGVGGLKLDTIKLDFPDEYLTSMSGHFGSIDNWGPVVFVRSLTFQSNKTTYGPYGTQQGSPFSFSMNGGKIVGFHGRAGWNLDSIGAYLKPLPNPNAIKPVAASQSYVANGLDRSIPYNVIQGSVVKGYDIVVAVRQKDDSNKISSHKPQRFPRELSSASSSSSSEEESNDKALALPSNAKKGSSKAYSSVTYASNANTKVGSTNIDTLPSNTNTKVGSTNINTLPSYTKNGTSNTGGSAVRYGPWGGSGGSAFDDGVHTGVRQVNLTRSAGIYSIKVLYDQNGKAIWGHKHGGYSAGLKSEKIVFDYPFEVLTHITGYYGPLIYMGPNVLQSLTFHTTGKVYGPYGNEQGTPFSSYFKEGKIAGFFGRGAWYIDSIGVHVIEGKVTTPPSSRNTLLKGMNDAPMAEMDNPEWSNKLVLAKRGGPKEEVSFGVVKDPAPCGPGPWGGEGGRPWDDGVFTGIKQIYLTRTDAIASIQIEYDRNGQSVWSARHGDSGEATNKIKFDYPNEVITCVCGYYGSCNKDEQMKVIKSLTIYTSRGKYGPYGEEIGTFFTSTTTEGKVVGFHGRSSSCLNAIGVHMQHWLGDVKPSMSTLYKSIFKPW